ncbi:hypothetical protein [Parasphingorhabdus sp.]|uniref:hypothetical protein n=1 Tax=Parasphingorhabdus sp. TaxID=2709688 RepID=UPI003001C334
MVAVKYPTQVKSPDPKMIAAVYKEALEYKRDHIAAIQSRPRFNFELHRRYNSAYSKLFSMMGVWGALPADTGLQDLPQAHSEGDEEDKKLLKELIDFHSMVPLSQMLPGIVLSQGISKDSIAMAPLGRPAIAPRLVEHMIENAGVDDTPTNRKIVLSTIAQAYSQACLDANREIEEKRKYKSPIPQQQTSDDIIDENPKDEKLVADDAELASAENRASAQVEESEPKFAQPASAHSRTAHSGLIDLRVSELCTLAVEENRRSQNWQDSACRNAKVIAEIFIAENGDLHLSQIERGHLLDIQMRLLKMPRIWGKNKEDRAGGMKTVFSRGEALSAQWIKDARKATEDKLPKVGFSPTTHNRHLNTLKQLFDFARKLEDGRGKHTHIYPDVSFNNLNKKDPRKKNKRLPVPKEEEVLKLLSGPIYTGCLSQRERFEPGTDIIHDSFYWGPLLLIVYGNRSNEFFQMPLKNVFEDATIPYVHVRTSIDQGIKTGNSERSLPIAPKLIELGFLNYVKELRAKGAYWLFPELNTTNVPARKRFLELVFKPLLAHHFPAGTSVTIDDKDIDTRSFRKFATSYLRKGQPKIELGIRQAFFGHARTTTLEGIYEDDPSLDELMPCVIRLQSLITSIETHPLKLRSEEKGGTSD